MVPPVGGNNFAIIIISPDCIGWFGKHAVTKLSFLFLQRKTACCCCFKLVVWFVRFIRVCSLCKEWNKQSRSVAPLVHDP